MIPSWGKWKLLDYYSRRLSKGDLSLAELIDRLFHNATIFDRERYSERNFSRKDVIFRERDANGELEDQGELVGGFFPPHSGDGISRTGFLETGHCLGERGTTHITSISREGREIRLAGDLQQVTPDNDGPYDIALFREMRELQLRRRKSSTYIRQAMLL